jgi:tRNA (uracil-5-)-methyltransferase
VISILRREEDISKLVYVSCDANAATQNFVDLGRSSSNQYPGEPFLPVKVCPIDLYPHTGHVETVILFEKTKKKPEIEEEVKVEQPEVENAPVKEEVKHFEPDVVMSCAERLLIERRDD